MRLSRAAVHADGWKITRCPVNGPASASRGATLAVAWFTSASARPSGQLAFSEDAGATFGPPIVPARRSSSTEEVPLKED